MILVRQHKQEKTFFCHNIFLKIIHINLSIVHISIICLKLKSRKISTITHPWIIFNDLGQEKDLVLS